MPYIVRPKTPIAEGGRILKRYLRAMLGYLPTGWHRMPAKLTFKDAASLHAALTRLYRRF